MTMTLGVNMTRDTYIDIWHHHWPDTWTKL